MFKVYCILLLLGHILGDYYFQSNKMALEKNEKFFILVKHCVIYGLVQGLVLGIVLKEESFRALFIVVASHFVIDCGKFVLVKYFNIYDEFGERLVYVVDQILHLIFIGIGAFVLIDKNIKCDIILYIFNLMGLNPLYFVKGLVLILLLHKPINITIKKLIEWYKPTSNNIVESNRKTGAFIGTMERYIIIIFMFLNQYSAIGLVLTAKSIARYKELSKKDFAEYYLMGTLLSTFISIILYIIIV